MIQSTTIYAEDADHLETFGLIDFQQVGELSVVTSSTAKIYGLDVNFATNGNLNIAGNFDELAEGETATISFSFTATDRSGASNATSEVKTYTLLVTGTTDQPTVENILVESGEFIGLDATDNEYFLADAPLAFLKQSFVAEKESLNKIEFEFVDGSTGSFKLQLVDETGNVVYLGNTLDVADVDPQGYVSTSVNVSGLVVGSIYTMEFVDIVGDPQISVYGSDLAVNDNIFDGAGVLSIPDGDALLDGYDLSLRLTYSNGAETVFESDSVELVYEGVISSAVVTDLDVTDTHTFHAFGEPSFVVENEAVITDLSVVVNADGSYLLSGNFDALADGDKAFVSFEYVANDGSVALNGTSEPATVTVVVVGTNDAPVVEDVSLNETVTGFDNLSAREMYVTDYSYIVKTKQSFVATDDVLSKVDMSFQSNSGTFKLAILDSLGNLVYKSDTQDIANSYKTHALEGKTLDIYLDAHLTKGETYTMKFVEVTGNPAVYLGRTADNADSLGVTHSRYGFRDGWDVLMKLNYNQGEEQAVFELDGYGEVYSSVLPVVDLDATDTHIFAVGTASVVSANGENVSANVTLLDPVTGAYKIEGNFDELAKGDKAQVSFSYTVTDDSGTLNNTSETKTITLEVTGTNDQPVVRDVILGSISEKDGYQRMLRGRFSEVEDADVLDTHSFQMIGNAVVTTDSLAQIDNVLVRVGGTRYDLRGNFDALAEGETATISFSYVAKDNTNSANSTSELKTATLLVTGTNDAPIIENIDANDTFTIGFNSLSNNTLTTIGIANIGETFVASEELLGNIKLALNSSSTGTFKLHILDSNGDEVYVSSTLDANNSDNLGVLSVDIGVSLVASQTYTVAFSEVVGDVKLAISRAENSSDGVGMVYLESHLDGYDANLSLSYGAAAEPIYATDTGLSTIFSGVLAAFDADSSDTHSFSLAGINAVNTTNGAIITGLDITLAVNGEYSVTGDFSALASGEEATINFDYFANDSMSDSNLASVTLVVTGAEALPFVEFM